MILQETAEIVDVYRLPVHRSVELVSGTKKRLRGREHGGWCHAVRAVVACRRAHGAEQGRMYGRRRGG